MAYWARRALPAPVFRVARRFGTALGAPVLFSLRSGHFRSSLIERAVDRHGQPLPWYTYPAIEFLAAQEFGGRHVLEWGAGQSSLWWASRCESVESYEDDREWAERLHRSVPDNVSVKVVDTFVEGVEQKLERREYDIVVVDGLDRLRCAELSVDLVSRDGCIVIDNSDGFWGTPGEYPIMELMRRKGFQRIDFYGYAPGVIAPHCTSICFRAGCFLTAGSGNPTGQAVD